MLAEALVRAGNILTIFALDYWLSPENVWPAQLEDAVSGYRYLVKECGAPEEKIFVLGDSAGGNLALALLTHLAVPHSRVRDGGEGLGKPAAAVLLSLWVSFRTEAESYKRNYYMDVLNAVGLAAMAEMVKGRENEEEEVWRFYTEFRYPLVEGVLGKTKWAEALPAKTSVAAGGNEVLISDIVGFVESVKEELGERGG